VASFAVGVGDGVTVGVKVALVPLANERDVVGVGAAVCVMIPCVALVVGDGVLSMDIGVGVEKLVVGAGVETLAVGEGERDVVCDEFPALQLDGGLADKSQICWLIQSIAPLIREYMPGNPGRPHPRPHDTMPT
jgi:hypothetical protein